jgi:hypothetical protein
MKLFEDCIEDIDRALDSGYPKKQQLYSLYLRKVKCLKFLKKNYVGCLADTMKVSEIVCNRSRIIKQLIVNIAGN